MGCGKFPACQGGRLSQWQAPGQRQPQRCSGPAGGLSENRPAAGRAPPGAGRLSHRPGAREKSEVILANASGWYSSSWAVLERLAFKGIVEVRVQPPEKQYNGGDQVHGQHQGTPAFILPDMHM